MTTQQQQYYYYYYQQQLHRKAQIQHIYNLKAAIDRCIAAGGNPLQVPELSAQYLYLENLGYFTFEDQDDTQLTSCAMLQRENN